MLLTFRNKQCLHSKVAGMLCDRQGQTWRSRWPIQNQLRSIRNTDYAFSIDINSDVLYAEFSKNQLYLAAVQRKDKRKTVLLYTVTKGQKKPYCSYCSSVCCKCWCLLNQYLEEQDPDETNYWDRRLHPQNIPPEHYENPQEAGKLGWNHETFEYPINRDPVFCSKWKDLIKGEFQIPDQLIASYNPNLKCKHGNTFREKCSIEIDRADIKQIFGKYLTFVEAEKLLVWPSFVDQLPLCQPTTTLSNQLPLCQCNLSEKPKS